MDDDDAVSIDDWINGISNLHDIRCNDQYDEQDVPITTTSEGGMNLPNVYQLMVLRIKAFYLLQFYGMVVSVIPMLKELQVSQCIIYIISDYIFHNYLIYTIR